MNSDTDSILFIVKTKWWVGIPYKGYLGDHADKVPTINMTHVLTGGT